jgi:hypothetical protein
MFVVYLTHYIGDKLPPWYIGSSSEDRVNDGYTGSVTSKKWSDIYYKELEENRHLFKTRILSRHETRDDAVAEEHRLQRMHKVVTNSLYFNESYATKNGCFTRDKTGELNPMYGQGEKINGSKNGRHKDNFTGDIQKVSEKISKALKATNKNKKGNNSAAKKYYVWDSINDIYIDIPKGHLCEYCEKYEWSYSGLYGSLSSKKPIQKRGKIKYLKSVGMQMFEGTYNES